MPQCKTTFAGRVSVRRYAARDPNSGAAREDFATARYHTGLASPACVRHMDVPASIKHASA
jgi:hypothetical protein